MPLGYARPPMSVRRILVTGANGHLGRRLFRHLAQTRPDLSLHALVRSERAADVLRALPENARPEVHVVDYLDAPAVEKAAAGCNAIVHLVGILKEGSTSRYEVAHEQTTGVLAAAAASAGVRRIVYLSILGSRPDSANACLASKGAAERLLLDGPVPATILRVPMVLGPGELAAQALAARARAPFVFVTRGGATLEQPIDADDLVRAIAAALEAEGEESRSLDLAGPESLPSRELLRRASELLGNSPWILPVPLGLVRAAAWLFERFSKDPPITRAMLDVLEHDDQIDPRPACAELGLELTPLDQTLKRTLEDSA